MILSKRTPVRPTCRSARRNGIVVGLALISATLLTACSDGEPDQSHEDTLREQLTKVCPGSDSIEITDADPGEPPEYSERQDEWGEGLEARATCDVEGDASITADLYEDTDPTADMKDLDQSYNNADGSSVYWAVREVETDQWIAIYTVDDSELVAPLADEGYELGG